MSEVKIGIKIEADGSKGQAALANFEGSLRQVEAKARLTRRSIEDLSDGWSRFSELGRKRLEAIDWANRLAQAVPRATQAVQAQTQAMAQQERTLQSWLSFWARAHMIFMGVQQVANFTKSVTQTADTYTNLNSRIKLVSGTLQELARAQTQLFEISQRNMTPLADTAQLYTRMAASIRDMGRSQADALGLTELVGQTLRISGTTASEAAGGLQQFGQALSSGVLRGEEFNSVMENMPRLARAIADGLGKPVSELRKMADQGQLTADTIITAIQSQAKAIQNEYRQMPVTVGGALQNLSNAWTRYIGLQDQGAGSSRQLAQSIQSIANNLDTIMGPVGVLAGYLINMATAVKRVHDELARLDQLRRSQGFLSALGNALFNQNPGTVAVDPEIERLMRMGRGEVPIDELARGREAQQQYFDGINRGAEEAAKSLRELNAAQIAVYQAAVKYKVNPAFALAIAGYESNFNPGATSPSGAMGLMQLMPGTAARYGVRDPYDPVQNAEGGVRYLRDLLAMFHNDLVKVAAAFNAGEHNVMKYKGVPPFAETQKYVGVLPSERGSVFDQYKKWQEKLNSLQLQAGDILDPKELEQARGDYFRFIEQTLSQRQQLEDAQSQARLAKNKIELQALRQQAEQAAQASERTIADVLQRQGLDAGLKAIAEAQAEQERYLREAQAKAGVADNEAIRTAQQRITDIDALIAKTREMGQWEQQGAELQNQRAIAEQALAKARIEAGAQDLDLQKALRQNQADYDALRQQAIRDQMQRELDAASTFDQRNAAIQHAIELEKQLGLTSTDSAKAAIELKQKEAEFTNKINAELELQKNLLIQLKAAKDQGATPEGMAILKSILEQYPELLKNISEANRPKIERSIAELAIERQATEDIMQVEKDRADTVRELQLRENAYWDQLISRMQEYAATWQEVTGIQNDAFSKLMVQTSQYVKNVAQIGDSYKDMRRKFGESGVLDLGDGFSQAANAVHMMAQTMLAVRSQYAEGTKGYEAMTEAATRMMEVQRALTLIEAILGVVHQATSGDPYTAIPRMIGVAAMMASMGLQTGLGGGASQAHSLVKYRDLKDANKGVFGDPTKQSESILKALEIIRDNSSNDLNYSAAMLQSLQNIEAAMAGVTNTVIRGVQPAAVKTGRMSGLGDLDIGGKDILGRLIGDLVLSTYRKISDFGIQAGPQLLADIIKKGFSGRVYTDVETTTKVFGMTISKSVKTLFSELDPTVAKEFTKAFQAIALAVQEGGKAFGLTADDFAKRMRGFVIDIGKLSTKGLTGEELQKKIQQMFSEQSDAIARRFMPRLGAFQQVGEGYFQTFIRVAEGINRAGGELERLGMTAINFRQIANKQGDVAAEIVRQTLLTQTDLSAGVRSYIDQLTGSAQDIIEAYKKLREASSLLQTAGLNAGNLDRTMINAAGGLAAFVDLMTTFNQEFLRTPERIAGQVRNLVDSFNRLGLVLPASKDGFRALISGLDTTTESGKKLFGAVLQLAPAFAELQNALEELRQKYNTDPLKEFRATLQTILDDFASLMTEAVQRVRDSGPLATALADMQRNRAGFGGQLGAAQAKRDATQAELDQLSQQLAAEQAKRPGQRNDLKIARLRKQIRELSQGLAALDGDINTLGQAVAWYDRDIAQALRDNDLATSARLAEERARLVRQQIIAIQTALEDVIDGLLEGVDQLQVSLDRQVAELQGPSAVFANSVASLQRAWEAYARYQQRVLAGRQRDLKTEESLIGNLQSAILEKYNAERAALEAQLATLTQLQDAIASLQDYVNGLLTGGLSPLSPEAKLEETRRQYEELLARARSGDADAIAKLQQAADAYLQAARDYFASGGGYADIFNRITQDLRGLKGIGGSQSDAEQLRSRIDALKGAAVDELKNLQTLIDSARQEAQRQAEEATRIAQEQMAAALAQASGQSSLISETNSGNQLVNTTNGLLSQQSGLMSQQIGLLSQHSGQLGEQTSWLYRIWNQLSQVPKMASGGTTLGGYAIVGEQGPELVQFAGPATVYPAAETRAALRDSQPGAGGDSRETARAVEAGIRVDQAAYQALLDELRQIKAAQQDQARSARLARVAA